MIATVGSSIYPMFKAGRLVTPSLERTWKPTTKPIEDEWMIPLPFTYSSDLEVGQMLAYIREFLSAHLGERSELFTVSRIQYEEDKVDGKQSKTIVASMRLTPYDLGINQTIRLHFISDLSTKRWYVMLNLHRRSGNPDVWVKSNLVFADALRKQFLLWKSVPKGEREKYIDLYRQMKEENINNDIC